MVNDIFEIRTMSFFLLQDISKVGIIETDRAQMFASKTLTFGTSADVK